MSLLHYDFNNSSQRALGEKHIKLSDFVIEEEHETLLYNTTPEESNNPRKLLQKRNSTPFNSSGPNAKLPFMISSKE